MRKGPAGSRRVAGSSPPVAAAGPPGAGVAVARLCPRLPSRCLRRPPRPLLPFVVAAAVAAVALVCVVWPLHGGTDPAPPPPDADAALRALLAPFDAARLLRTFLRPLLHERVPGGPGSREARQHLRRQLSALSTQWHLEVDSFRAATPRGLVTFSSLVATAAPAAPRRLVLACHYDTKVLPPPAPGARPPGATPDFVGATDSAVPCAILLEVAATLDQRLRRAKEQGAGATLQLLFLDGEEAFGAWSPSDSLYGARHLATKMAATSHGPRGTQLSAMSLLVLLDLLGAPRPAIHSHFPQTLPWFLRLVAIEQRLRALGELQTPAHPPLFRLEPAPGPVEDDHLPFLRRGVPVLHVIPTPFPEVWHSLGDTEANLHPPTVADLARVLVAFVAEFLRL